MWAGTAFSKALAALVSYPVCGARESSSQPQQSDRASVTPSGALPWATDRGFEAMYVQGLFSPQPNQGSYVLGAASRLGFGQDVAFPTYRIRGLVRSLGSGAKAERSQNGASLSAKQAGLPVYTGTGGAGQTTAQCALLPGLKLRQESRPAASLPPPTGVL